MLENIQLDVKEQLFILNMHARYRGTYLVWRMGLKPYYVMSKETFYRHAREMLKLYKINILEPFHPQNETI